MRFKRGLKDIVKDTVNAITDHQFIFKGFNMDIAGALFIALGHQAVDKANNRRLVRGVQQIFRLKITNEVRCAVTLDFFNDIVSLAGFAFITFIDCLEDFRRRSKAGLNRLSGQGTEIVEQ